MASEQRRLHCLLCRRHTGRGKETDDTSVRSIATVCCLRSRQETKNKYELPTSPFWRHNRQINPSIHATRLSSALCLEWAWLSPTLSRSFHPSLWVLFFAFICLPFSGNKVLNLRSHSEPWGKQRRQLGEVLSRDYAPDKSGQVNEESPRARYISEITITSVTHSGCLHDTPPLNPAAKQP